ncbi:universal stress protein [Halomarina oriensis]|uniref:Universal stress protein n=1 Tax=Halomarina oriensis TaxID=671145 RepID=A0A6B0GFR1_9EURY|nr:universal stress protein [Halomarina oriensis]MWG33662.1 universal stress protein [Halomarina oriensis]
MTTFVVATKNVETSERINDYLVGRLTDGDRVYVVNSQEGGDDSEAGDIRMGTEAIDALTENITVPVETHQFVRGNDPAEDILAAATEYDADEICIAIRKRNPTGKIVFGSTAQDLLLSTDRPVVAVPLETER